MPFHNERSKIQRRHLEKLAFVYVRQSCPQNVRKHVVGGQRQLDIQLLALELGWPKENIIVVTADTGNSGASTEGRFGYLDMLCAITEGQVGAVFSLESTRLGRDSADWHHLIKICHVTDTLIIDPDGIYDASDSNDSTLMKFKALIGDLELRLIASRMRGAMLELAKKGELHLILPVGFVYSDQGTPILDPDPSVQKVVRLVFEVFETVKTARGVAMHFNRNNLLFPNYLPNRRGECEWVTLTPRRVNSILRNPTYAGTYAYGRSRIKRRAVVTDGEAKVKNFITRTRPDEWQFVRHDAHPGYISWATFLSNDEQLLQNRTIIPARGASRTGAALLQGLAICGKCGRRMSVGYSDPNLYYKCWYAAVTWGQPTCQHANGVRIDLAVEQAFLKAIAPIQLNLTIEAVEQLHQQRNALERQRGLQIEHAEAAVTHSRNRLLHIDFNNRYAFDCAQVDLKKKEEEVIRLRRQQQDSRDAVLKISPAERKQLNAAIKNLPLLWGADSTSMVMKKNLLRCLIDDVTLTRNGGQVDVSIRWRTQACTKLEVTLPFLGELSQMDPQIVDVIKTHAPYHTDREIAGILNKSGFRNMVGGDFQRDTIFHVRQKYQIVGRQLRTPSEETLSSSSSMPRVPSTGRFYCMDPQIVEIVKTLAAKHSDQEIASRLNEAGFRNMIGREFCRESVWTIRQRYRIAVRERIREAQSACSAATNQALSSRGKGGFGRFEPGIIEVVKKLAPNHSDREIAAALNGAGFRNMEGQEFLKKTVRALRHRYQIAGRPQTTRSSASNIRLRASRKGDFARTDPQIVELVKTLAPNHSDSKIAAALKEAGFRNMIGKDFCRKSVCRLRQRYEIAVRERREEDFERIDPQIVEVVKTMAPDHSDREIAAALKEAGFRNTIGRAFCKQSICKLRQRYEIAVRERVVTRT